MDRRIPLLAALADVVAVLVFAGVGRSSHAEAFEIAGLLATGAPFLAGLAVAWATPYVRADPPSLTSGAVVFAVTAVVGFALRAIFLGRLPLSFVLVASVALVVLLVGWRALSMAVARRAIDRVG
ncbi:Protein of unknown function [Pseudonocardia thermophila]|mgnify:FL=1|uniref:DUF3054 domain-containing protein n=1 Tax=Pseudonocardia thermophila TaxID=1848 RepID=A0A1M6ZCJ5_PSETH|nr:DUF3054 domain-containing protein [Pseudonocardia thermophila]SHL28221.1 Protein of unknown function [Pseudonocardia thermophila]